MTTQKNHHPQQEQQSKLDHNIQKLKRVSKRPLEYLIVVVLTNHTTIADLINLIKAIRWW